MRLISLVTLLALATLPPQALAGGTFALDPNTGVKAAIASVQEMLSAPPLPRLDGGKTWEFPVSVNYIQATSSQNDALNAGQQDTGKFSGYAYSVGFISKEADAVRFFIWFMDHSLSGSINVSGTSGATVPDLKAEAYAGFVGANYRLIGQPKSPFAMGIFGGPGDIRLKSSFDIDNPGSNAENIETEPNIYGVLAGTQINLLLGPIVLNPYFMYFYDLSSGCRDVTSASPVTCANLKATFTAGGINVGYKGLMINVYSEVISAPSLDSVKTHSYGVSYTFGFEEL